MTVAKIREKQSRKGFKPGQSNNPSGRPYTSRNKSTLALETLLEGEGEAITRKTIENALNGDMTAIKLCIEMLIPLRKDGPICFDLTEMKSADDSAKAMASILRTLANGDITPNEASSVSRIIEAYRKTLETAELEDRLEALEQKV